jgi:RNA polymerase sigma factor (sigma-70 family)
VDGQAAAWIEVIDGLRSWDARAIQQIRMLSVGYLRSIDSHGLRDSLDDICQEAFIALFLHSPEMGDSRAAVCYMRKTLRSAYIDHLRRQFGRRRPAPGGGGEGRSQAWRYHVSLDEYADCMQDETAVGSARDAGLGDAFGRLCPLDREVLLDKYVLGLSDAEGAGRVSESVSTYRRVVSRALGKLNKLLS